MSDKEKAVAVLQVASETCSAALKALRDSRTALILTPDHVREASLDTRLNDYVSILSLLYQNSTKLAIALKPSSLEYSAAITPAKELAAHTDALASCACSLNEADHGRTLAFEVRWSADDVLSSLESLLGVYTSDVHGQGSATEVEAGEPYLVRTGIVHEAIDRARGISRTNREAVRKRWDGILGGLCDCEKEAREMIEEEEGNDDEKYDEFSDLDGLDETGEPEGYLREPKKSISASQEELGRLTLAHSLFKFTHALVKRVDLIILQPSSRVALPSPRLLDELLSTADKLLKASDDLVHALYIPQTQVTVSIKSKDLEVLFEEARSELMTIGLVTGRQESQGDRESISHLSQRTASLKLQDVQGEGALMSKERKWFDTCFAHIVKTITGLV